MTRKLGRMATYPKLGNSQFSLHEERPHGDAPRSMRVLISHQAPAQDRCRKTRELCFKTQTTLVPLPSKQRTAHTRRNC